MKNIYNNITSFFRRKKRVFHPFRITITKPVNRLFENKNRLTDFQKPTPVMQSLPGWAGGPPTPKRISEPVYEGKWVSNGKMLI